MIATVALSSLAWLAQPAGTPATPPTPAVPAAPLAWTFTAGRADRYTVTLNQSALEQSGATTLLAVTSEQRLEFTAATLSTTPAGAAVVEFKLDALRVSITPAADAKPIVVDSAAAPGNEEFDPNAAARALVGLAFKLTLTREGAVDAVGGLPELRERVKKAFAEHPSVAALAEPILAGVNERSLAAAFGAAFTLSDAAASPALNLPGVGLLEARPSVQRETSGAQALIRRTVAYTLAAGNPDAAARTYDIAVEEGKLESAAAVVPAEGRLASFTSTLSLKLRYTPKPGAGDQTLVRSVSQTTKVEPRKPDAAAPTHAGPERP